MASPSVGTAFSFYVESCRQEFERGHPGETPCFEAFMQNCLSTWQGMSAQQKESFVEQQEAERKQQFSNEIDPQDSDAEKLNKKLKRAHFPCDYPRSAFYWYCKENRDTMQKENPNTDPSNVAMLLGRAWMATDPREKVRYEQLSKQICISYLQNPSEDP